jgi:iron complex outermembrane receptor protein
VAIVIDGVTLSNIKPFNQDLFDIQQIEVLKGPQSALYGRNAAAGAVVITTKPPGDTFEGHVVGAVGNYNTSRMSASVSGPIADGLKFAAAGSFRNTDGAFTNITTGEKVQRSTTESGRLRLLYQPNDKLSLDFQIGGHHSSGGGTAYNAQFVGLPIGGFSGAALDANNTNEPFVSDVPSIFNESFGDVQLKADYDLGFAKLTSITAYNDLTEYFGSESPPYVPMPGETVQQYTYHDKNFSEEIRLTSPSNHWIRYQVGFYFLRYDRNQTSKIDEGTDHNLPADSRGIDPPTAPEPTLSYDNPIYRTTSYAPFASLQFDITRQLHLNLAGRYDTEDRSVRDATPSQVNPLTGASYNNCVALTNRPVDQCHESRTFKQFEPKVSLSYDIARGASVYASYGQGFKSGGFNPIGSRQALIAAAAALGQPASSIYVQDQYNKETSSSYEIGAKLHLFNTHLSFDIAGFKTDVSGAEQFAFFPSAGLQTVVSIDKVELKGVDLDFDALLPGDIRLYGGYGYTDGTVKKFAGNPAYDGNVAPGSFKYTVNLGVTRTFDLPDELQLVPRVDFDRYGPIWWDVANTPGTRRNPLDLVNARLTLKSSSKWQISLYGDNLTNAKYFQEVVPLLSVFTVNYRGPLMTYGIEARVDF